MTMYVPTPLTKETRQMLKDRKVHFRETWNDIILRLIEVHDQYIQIIRAK